MIRTTLRIAAAIALVWLLAASSAQAAIFSFEAFFDGLQMVPPDASPGFGQAAGTYDDTSGNFTLTVGTYQDLLGGATNILLNDAAAGANGPLIAALVLDTPGATTGTFSGGTALTAPQWADMLAGNTYLRVTSQVFPTGEIRGQLTLVPEPGSMILLAFGFVGILYAAVRRRNRAAHGN